MTQWMLAYRKTNQPTNQLVNLYLLVIIVNDHNVKSD